MHNQLVHRRDLGPHHRWLRSGEVAIFLAVLALAMEFASTMSVVIFGFLGA